MLAGTVQSEDLGSYGRGYPIKERDAIDAMKDAARQKLANGGQERMIKGAQDRYMASLNNIPMPEHIKAVSTPRTRLVDLTETLGENVLDDQGTVIAVKGTKLNPLRVLPLTKQVFFIDARDEKQIEWVRKAAGSKDKIIVLGGSVLKAGEQLKRRVYMDIPGLHKRMQISNVPSLVSQQDVLLKIQEVKL